jgi:chromosome segregation ATPase
MTDEAARGTHIHRDHLQALLECWERQPALIIPCSRQRRAGEIASWIRRLLKSDAEIHEAKRVISSLKLTVEKLSHQLTKREPPGDDRKLIVQLQQAGTRLANQLAKSEREVRDIALDRDRWRKRANEAEAAIKSSGLKSKQHQYNATALHHSDQATEIGI